MGEPATRIIERAKEDSWFRCTDKRKHNWIQPSFCANTCSQSKMDRCKIRQAEMTKGL